MRKAMVIGMLALLAAAVPAWAAGRYFESFYAVTWHDREGTLAPGQGYIPGLGLLHTIDPTMTRYVPRSFPRTAVGLATQRER